MYFGSSAGTSSITNSIVYGNDSTSGEDEIQDNGITLTVTYSDILGGWTGTGNINSDPLFVGSGDYSLTCGSPCIETGNDSALADDLVDLDGDMNTGEDIMYDLPLENRIIGAHVDMGAYERTGRCCAGDVNFDGQSNTQDLLAVIINWGTCGTPCPADIAPAPCGDNAVGVADLLAVIGNWGPCPPECPGDAEDEGIALEDAEDCINAASQHYTPYSLDWQTYVERCIEGLQQAGLIP